MKSIPPFLCFLLILLIACKKNEADIAKNYLSPGIIYGTVQFANGCNPKTDSLIRFGIALVHHMTYEDAAYTFDKIIRKDPGCFWGYWGKAMTYIHPLWPDIPSQKDIEAGYILTKQALTLAKTNKEKIYLATVSAYFQQGTKTKIERLADTEKAWATAHEQLPDDPEAELFYGLFRLATVSPSDKSYTVQNEVGTMAERILQKYPDHPGAFNYGINAYNVPPLASKALDMAWNYGKIAPEIPYALHMPTHIFSQLGLWQESIDWNTRSINAALKHPVEGKISPIAFQAMDYLVYAYLQLGQDEKAKEVVKQLDTLKEPLFENAATVYGLAATHARILLEEHNWAEAAKIARPDTNQLMWKNFPQYEALIWYARGIGGARNGQLVVATEAIQQLQKLEESMGDSPDNKYWRQQIANQKHAVKSWYYYLRESFDNALDLMQNTTELEESSVKTPNTPGALLPASELYGDLLMVTNQPSEALTAYETSLSSNPNRLNALYGAAQAAEKMGDAAKAKEYYSKLLALKGNASSTRKEFDEAQKKVNGK